MINEPITASLTYGLHKVENEEKELLFLDFGGGTLDFTLMIFIKNDDDEKYYDVEVEILILKELILILLIKKINKHVKNEKLNYKIKIVSSDYNKILFI